MVGFLKLFELLDEYMNITTRSKSVLRMRHLIRKEEISPPLSPIQTEEVITTLIMNFFSPMAYNKVATYSVLQIFFG